MRKSIALAALALASMSLSACASTDVAALAQAANELDPGCYKNVDIRATPILLFGWPVPVVSVQYNKVCNPSQAKAEAPAAGGVVAGAATAEPAP